MIKDLKKVSIITVNFNQPGVTEELLASLILYSSYPDCEIIVVDNGSKPDPIPNWKEKYPGFTFIRSEENFGFAGGNNLGIREAGSDYFFLVNNDTEVTSGLVERLVNIMDQNPRIGALSPKIMYFDEPDRIQYAGFTEMNFNTGRNKCIGQSEKDEGQYNSYTGPTGYAHGAAMMVRKSVVDEVGLMPENFFLYYEEMDWCEKMKGAGYEIWIDPLARIFHKESMSVGKNSRLKEYFMTRNRILFIRRNASALSKALFFFHFIFVVSPRNLAAYLLGNNPGLASQFFRAIWWNITHKKDSRNLGYNGK